MPISRKDEGILGNLTAQKNITISMLDKVGFLINRKKEHDITLHMMEDFNVQPKIRNRILPPSAEETSRRLYCHAGLQPIKIGTARRTYPWR